MKRLDLQLKNEIKQLIETEMGDCKVISSQRRGRNAMIYKLRNIGGYEFYLKVIVDERLEESLSNERVIYKWLSGEIPVPGVKFYKQTKMYEAICLTAIEGRNLSDLMGIVSNGEITKIYAGILRELHSISIRNCGIKKGIDQRLMEINKKISNNQIATGDFEEENRQKKPLELFDELLHKIPGDEELVFTHGDYCFDNVIVKENKLNGLIDMGRGGVADKYQDISLAVRNIKQEFGTGFVDLFFQEYGLQEINQNKIDFYILLDEFY